MADKKRVAVYDPAAQAKWAAKNPERRKYLTHRSRARSFLRDVATMEDLDEMQAIIDERRNHLIHDKL